MYHHAKFHADQCHSLWDIDYVSDYVVMSDIINTFKNRLDAHWKHRDFLFHYSATYTVGCTIMK